MTKKHYEAIAEAIADVIRPYDERAVQSLVYEIIDNLADFFEQDNPKFDRQRFMESCGIKKSS